VACNFSFITHKQKNCHQLVFCNLAETALALSYKVFIQKNTTIPVNVKFAMDDVSGAKLISKLALTTLVKQESFFNGNGQ
jgi:hypothetical protein